MVEIYVSGVNFIFALLVHSCVILFIITGNGVASEIFNLNLSVCEIMFCLSSLLSLLIKDILFTPLAKLSPGRAFTGRPLFQCLICAERYLAVVHPVTFLKYKPLRYRVICCTAAWIIVIASCLSCMLSIISKKFYIYSCFFSMELLFFLFIQLFCCVAVLRALKQSGLGERRREREEENPIKKRAFYLILITTVNMVLMHVPYTISGVFTALTQYVSVLWFISFICFMVAGLVQPVLYLHRTGRLFCLRSS